MATDVAMQGGARMTRASVPSWSHRPALDGVRTVAVYLVVLFHSGIGVFDGGFVGVDVFFVLSGFLITNVLLNDVSERGRVRFARFYARRARRLLPAALVVVVATCLLFLAVASVVERLPLVRDAQSALLYVANWRFLSEQNDYFATGVAKSPFLHFWSLGIEEQFYVVFPVLLVVVTRAARRRRWLPYVAFGALCALSLVAQFAWSHANPSHAYYGTDARAYQLLAGVLLAYALRGRRPSIGAASGAATVGLAGVVVAASGVISASTSTRGVLAAAAAVLLIGGVAVSTRGAVPQLLAREPVAYLGRISYGTYLWHWPVIVVIAHLVSLPSVVVAGIATLVATALASASYHWVEMPIRRARVVPRLQWVTVAAGVTACAAVAAFVVPPVLHSNTKPAVATAAVAPAPQLPKPLAAIATARRHAAAHHRERVPSGLQWSKLAADYGPERTCTAHDPQQCIVVTGPGPRVVLVGDSHGRMLAPALIALAHDHGFTLALNVLPSCPWQAQLSNLSQPPASQRRCTQARDVWYRTVLPQLHPDVVILAEYARDDPAVYGHTLRRTGGSDETLAEVVRNTTNETLARITATGARALVVDDTIRASFDPLDCLARATYVDQCSVPVPRPPVSDGYFAAAAWHMRNVFTLDVNPVVCPAAPLCAAMLDGINVWRNDNHLSTRILVHFRAQIWARMLATHAFRGLLG